MLKIILTNTTTNEEWSAERETQAEIDIWLNSQKEKPRRNIEEKWYQENVLTQEEILIAIDSRYTEIGNDIYIKEYKLPAQATYTITDITDVINADAQRNENKEVGRVLKELSNNILDIIAGYSLKTKLSYEQIVTLKTTFANILELLNTRMPITAKPLIESITPDGVVINQSLLDDIALEYADYYAAYPEILT